MKNIFQILQEKEEQMRNLQAQIEKLRAAAEIVAQDQGVAAPAAAPMPEPARSAPVVMPAPARAAAPSDAPVAGHRPVWP